MAYMRIDTSLRYAESDDNQASTEIQPDSETAPCPDQNAEAVPKSEDKYLLKRDVSTVKGERIAMEVSCGKSHPNVRK